MGGKSRIQGQDSIPGLLTPNVGQFPLLFYNLKSDRRSRAENV